MNSVLKRIKHAAPLKVVGISLLALLSPAFVFAALQTQNHPVAAKLLMSCFSFDETKRGLCYEETVPGLFPEASLPEIFDAIRTLQNYDPAISECHVTSHRLGETVVALYPLEWRTFIEEEPLDGLCAFGMVHGLSIGAFRGKSLTDSQIKDELPRFVETCENQQGMPRNYASKLICYHGLGHIFYYITDADVGRAMRLCDDVTPDESYWPQRTRCHAGVAMKLYTNLVPNDDSMPDPHHLTRETMEPFCKSLGDVEYSAACRRLGWPLFYDELIKPGGIDAFCGNEASERLTHACYGRLTAAISWRLRFELDTFYDICEAVRPERRATCYINGAYELLNSGSGSQKTKRALEVCQHARDQYADACMKDLASISWRYAEKDTEVRRAYCAPFPEPFREDCLASRQ